MITHPIEKLLSLFGSTVMVIALAHGQNVGMSYPEYLNLVRDVVKSTVYLESGRWAGTGLLFVVPYTDSTKVGNAFVLTAKHILAIGSPDTATRYNDFANVYLNLRSGSWEKRRYRTAAISKNHDLVILVGAEQKRPWRQYDIVDSAVTPQFFATPESTAAGQYVLVAGFPAPFDTRVPKLVPVVQSGIVAQVPGGDTMLIDIHTNKGNSGGGAFTVSRDGRLQILGIVFGYRKTAETVVVDVKRDSMGKLLDVTTEKTNSALGAVISVSRLRQIAKELLTSKKVITIE